MKGIITKVNRTNYEVLTNTYQVLRKKNNVEELTIGDYVEVEADIISKLHKRTSVLKRKNIVRKPKSKLMAANMDLILICLSANKDFNMTKFYNYYDLTKGVCEVKVLLTKADLTTDIDYYRNQLPIDMIPVSIFDEMDELKEVIKDKTVLLIGSSGVGKSSVISKLMDIDIKVNSIREYDAQGRHTTTARTMYVHDDYRLMDVPGIRIVYAVENSFEEIEEAAKYCKFSNCKHLTEPKCHVKDLVSQGEITQRDLDKYHKSIGAK